MKIKNKIIITIIITMIIKRRRKETKIFIKETSFQKNLLIFYEATRNLSIFFNFSFLRTSIFFAYFFQ